MPTRARVSELAPRRRRRGRLCCSGPRRSHTGCTAGLPAHTQRPEWFRHESLWQPATQLSAEEWAAAPCGATGLGLRSTPQADLRASGALRCPPRPPVDLPRCSPPEFVPVSAPTAPGQEQQHCLPARTHRGRRLDWGLLPSLGPGGARPAEQRSRWLSCRCPGEVIKC